MADPDLHMRVQLGGLDEVDPRLYPMVLRAVAKHLGVELRKASSDDDHDHDDHEGPDPRYPKLYRLIDLARRDWNRFGEQLVAAVMDLQRDGKLFPLNRDNEEVLRRLFHDHESAIVVRMTGRGDARTVEKLIAAGLVRPDVRDTSWISTSWRLGRALPMLEAHPEREPSTAEITQLVREAMRVELTPQDQAAIAYVQRRGEVFMRRPASMATGGALNTLNEAELDRLRAVTAAAVERRAGHRTLARDLRDVVNGNPTLQNDMDRVARTELVFAHNHGAYTALKTQAAAVGMTDPQVCKLVSPKACVHCKRIWGLPSNPTPYKLSMIEQREAAGGNFRLPAKSWGPVIGPVHPNCTEGPLMLYDPKFIAGANALAARLKRR